MLDFQGVFLMFFVNIFWFRLPNFSGDLACQKNTLELQIGISMNQKRWTRVLPQQLSGWKQNRKPYILRLILDVNFRVWSWWAGKPWKRPLRILKAKLWTFASEDLGFFHTLACNFGTLKDELDAENLNKLWCFQSHSGMYTLMPPNCLSELRSARRRYFLCWVSSNANPRNGSKPQELWRSVKWDVVDFDFGMFLPTMAVRKTMKSKRCRFALLLLWVTGMVGEHPKSQCVGFDKAMYSNLGCPRGVDAWVRWRFVALVQAKKICDALAPWVLRDIEALNTVWALTFQRYGLLRLPNVQHKKLFTAFHVMSLKFFYNTYH